MVSHESPSDRDEVIVFLFGNRADCWKSRFKTRVPGFYLNDGESSPVADDKIGLQALGSPVAGQDDYASGLKETLGGTLSPSAA